jgi:hypothetical protein
MNEAISFGGGINSVAMTILLVQRGWRGLIGFADTLGEKPGTYCYIDYFESHFLRRYGLEITRLKPGSDYHCSMSQVGLETYCLQAGVIPLLAVRWCSSRWKGRPLDRWAADNGITIQYIGFSADEARRANGKPDHQRYPLIDEEINREGCRQIILDAGLEVPPKSSCFFCPGQTISEWQRLFYDSPDLFSRAQILERNASQAYGKVATLNNHLSLDEMLERGWPEQMEMDLSA